MPDRELDGRVALVTGSTGTIGGAIAEALAAAGASIALTGVGVSQHEMDARCAQLAAAHSVRAFFVEADMTTGAGVRALCAAVAKTLGKVDILVNCAGAQYVAPLDEYPEDRWEMLIALNLSAAFHATKAVLPAMRAARWGRVVSIASVHGLIASVGKTAYTASKHGLVGLTKAAALDAAGSGVTCNVVCPGFVRTPLIEAQIAARAEKGKLPFEAAAADLVGEKHPSRAFVQPAEVAAYVRFLCGESAAQITGCAQVIDGGWSAL